MDAGTVEAVLCIGLLTRLCCAGLAFVPVGAPCVQGCLVAPTLSVGAVLLQQAAASMAFHYAHAEILESQPPGAPQVCHCWRGQTL